MAESSLGVILKPRRTQGISSTQDKLAPLALKASFSRRCILSTSPLLCGWKAVVRTWLMPSSLQKSAQTLEVNWAPQSVVRVDGTPKRATQWRVKAENSVRADVSLTGMASGQRVLRSTIVSTDVHPPLDFNGPTTSR